MSVAATPNPFQTGNTNDMVGQALHLPKINGRNEETTSNHNTNLTARGLSRAGSLASQAHDRFRYNDSSLSFNKYYLLNRFSS